MAREAVKQQAEFYIEAMGIAADPHTEDIVYRLRKRAEIRRQIPGRKSVEENKPDRLADLLDEAATEIERLRNGT
jgi:hypothetical protein